MRSGQSIIPQVIVTAMFVAGLANVCSAGTIRGRIVDDQTGSPIADAAVNFTRESSEGAQQIRPEKTDGEGRFESQSVAQGVYRVTILRRDYMDLTFRAQPTDPPAKTIAVRMVPLGSVSGRLADQRGRPVGAGRIIALTKAPEEPASPLPYPSFPSFLFVNPLTYEGGDRLEAGGKFTIRGLPPGEYAFGAAYGAASRERSPTNPFLTRGINVPAGSGFHIHPEAAKPEFREIIGGETEVNLTVPVPEAVYSISGSIDLSKLPPPQPSFRVALSNPRAPFLAIAIGASGMDGAFRFDGVTPGSYDVLASTLLGKGSEQLGLFARTRVEVSDKNVAELVLTPGLGRAARLVVPQAAPVRVFALEDWGLEFRDRLIPTQEVARGRAEGQATELAPGRYAVVSGDVHLFKPKVFDLTAGDQVVMVTPESPGAIRGKLHTGGRPASDFAIVLLTCDPTEGQPFLPSDRRRAAAMQVAFPDAQFQFSFDRIRPGNYRIAARPAGDAQGTRWVPNFFSGMIPITITGGGTLEVSLPAP